MNPTLKGIDQWPNTSSLSPSSPVEAFSEPGMVETAEAVFEEFWGRVQKECLDQGVEFPEKKHLEVSFVAGWRHGLGLK